MVFMMGIYWCARSPETERMRIRDRSVGAFRDWWEGFEEAGIAEERMVVCLLMWVRARVRAPAMDVVREVGCELGEVVDTRWDKEVSRASWTSRNGRYLLASSNGGGPG